MKTKKEIFKMSLDDFKEISGLIPLNSEFDDSLKASDLRLMKTIFIDESNEDHEDHLYHSLVQQLSSDIEYDLQCLTLRLTKDEPEWESIIAYPLHVYESKTRNKYYRIQGQLERLSRNLNKIKTYEE